MFIDAGYGAEQPQRFLACLVLASTPILAVGPIAGCLPAVFYRRPPVASAAPLSGAVEPGAHGVFCPAVGLAHQCGADAPPAPLAAVERGDHPRRGGQIGRASCRERVQDWVRDERLEET